MKIFKNKQSNIELLNICEKLDIPVKIVMKDELIGNISDGNYIVNLQNSNERGSHWTVLIKRKGKYFYSDSFGAPPPQTLIDNLKINSDNLFFNDHQIQDVDSTLCGYFAIYFLLCFKGKNAKANINKYLNTFDLNNQINNNKIINNIFSQL